jgi:hypothetical protein
VGGDLNINRDYNEDLTLIGGDVDYEGAVTGKLKVIGGDVRLRGTVTGSVEVIGGNNDVEMDVTEDVTIKGGSNWFEGNVGGDLSISGPDSTVGENSVINGETTVLKTPLSGLPDSMTIPSLPAPVPFIGIFGLIAGWLWGIFWMIIIAGILYLLAEKHLTAISIDVPKDQLRKAGTGLVAWFGLVFLTIVLSLTILLLPITIPVGILLILSLAWAQILVAPAIVNWINKLLSRRPEKITFMTYVKGLIIYSIVGFIPILGWLITAYLSFLGFGTLSLYVWDLWKGKKSAKRVTRKKTTRRKPARKRTKKKTTKRKKKRRR